MRPAFRCARRGSAIPSAPAPRGRDTCRSSGRCGADGGARRTPCPRHRSAASSASWERRKPRFMREVFRFGTGIGCSRGISRAGRTPRSTRRGWLRRDIDGFARRLTSRSRAIADAGDIGAGLARRARRCARAMRRVSAARDWRRRALRRGQDGGKPRRLHRRKLCRGDAEIVLRGRRGAVDAGPPFDDVQVDLHDPPLRQDELGIERERRLERLADPARAPSTGRGSSPSAW